MINSICYKVSLLVTRFGCLNAESHSCLIVEFWPVMLSFLFKPFNADLGQVILQLADDQ